ncbi:NAD dependent epimerase/dehydratase [Auriculariales sp. MPI-PUGE-AT-0066]|nr:NAD dependent epimerase/dehydratase [Auriculariales sp. MPI-PUGE-AT-0066]
MPDTFLVTGATGQQGGATARELLATGAKVHAYVRDASKPAAKELESLGATLFVGDYGNVDAIQAATVGVKGIFINPAPEFGNPEGERQQVQRFVSAAREAGSVDTLVLSSANWVPYHQKWLADDPNYPLKDILQSQYNAEQALLACGFKYHTILRPSWLLHNYTLPTSLMFFPEFAQTGEMRSAIRPDLKIAQLDAYDVGKFAAAALLNPELFHGKQISLAVANLSMQDIAREISAVSGKDVPVVFLEPGELMKDPSNFFAMMRGVMGSWTNAKEVKHTEEDFALQNSFGIKLTPVRESFERLKGSLLTTSRP